MQNHLSHVMRKPAICKQQRRRSSVDEQAGLSQKRGPKTPKTGFLVMWQHQ